MSDYLDNITIQWIQKIGNFLSSELLRNLNSKIILKISIFIIIVIILIIGSFGILAYFQSQGS